MDRWRASFGAAMGAVGLGTLLLYPFIVAGWCLGGMLFGGGSFGTPSGVGIYVGMAAAPIVGGLIGYLITACLSQPKRNGEVASVTKDAVL